jgi:hypothetical protein
LAVAACLSSNVEVLRAVVESLLLDAAFVNFVSFCRSFFLTEDNEGNKGVPKTGWRDDLRVVLRQMDATERVPPRKSDKY